jgi:hypothetical protein
VQPAVEVVEAIVVVRRTAATSMCSTRCERRTMSLHCRQAGTSNLLLHDDAGATNATGSIGSTAKQGSGPGEVEIDLPGGGAVEGSGRLRGSKKNLNSDYHIGGIDCV